MFLKKYEKFSNKFDETTNILMQYEKMIKKSEISEKSVNLLKNYDFQKM